MLNFRKIAAACNGEIVRKYYTQDLPKTPPRKASTPPGATSIPASGLPPITPAGVSGRALGPTCPAPLLRPSGSIRDKSQRCRARSPFRGQARRHRRASGPTARRSAGSISCSHQKSLPPSPPRLPPHRRKPLRSRTRSSPPMTPPCATLRPTLVLPARGMREKTVQNPGEVGWVTFVHDAARPTLALQDGPNGATYLIDAPIAGDPHYHPHNFCLIWLSPKMAGSARSTPAPSPPIASTNTAPISRPNLPTASALWACGSVLMRENEPSSCRISRRAPSIFSASGTAKSLATQRPLPKTETSTGMNSTSSERSGSSTRRAPPASSARPRRTKGVLARTGRRDRLGSRECPRRSSPYAFDRCGTF